MRMRSVSFEEGGIMAPAASTERPAEMNAVIICTFNIDKESSMASARSKQTYTIGWDGCGSLPFRNGHRITTRLDRHFKTNHRLAFPISVLSPQDHQIHNTASFNTEFGDLKKKTCDRHCHLYLFHVGLYLAMFHKLPFYVKFRPNRPHIT